MKEEVSDDAAEDSVVLLVVGIPEEDAVCSEKGAIEGDDVVAMTVVHDLQFSEDLFPYGRFCVNQYDLS